MTPADLISGIRAMEQEIASLRAQVAALTASTPSPAPERVSGADLARGDGVSARACWDCAHDSIGDGRGICWRTARGERHIVSEWIRNNCTTEPMPGAKDCPGWAPKSGEVSDAE